MQVSLIEELQLMFESEDNPGVMVALYPDYDVAKKIYIKSGEDLDELHVTLVYFGKLSKVGMTNLHKISHICEKITQKYSALHGSIGGIGRFNASESSDGRDVFYASIDCPDLVEVRQSLIHLFDKNDIEYKKQHGFTPHCTLKYISPLDPLPQKRLPQSLDTAFEYLTLTTGKNRVPFAFRGVR